MGLKSGQKAVSFTNIRHAMTVLVVTSCLAGQSCSPQGLQLLKTINDFSLPVPPASFGNEW